MNFKTRLSVLILSTPVLAFVLVGGFMGKASAGSDDQGLRHLRVFEDVVSLVMSNYVEEVKIDRAMEGALRGLAEGLDPDSAYLNAAQVKQIEAGDTLPEGGVGIELTRQYYLRVIAARDGSPAAKAGLQTGDYVRAIDGKPTREMSVFEGSRLLRGQPGSTVTLTIIRGNAAEPHEIALVRDRAAGPAVTSRMLGADTGYVRIPAFTSGVAGQLDSAVASLTKSGATSLVIDLRRTAEGSYDHAIQAARLFVKTGTIAMKGGRDSRTPAEKIAAAAGDGKVDLPVSLLVTAGTSGAAEVFAAAIDSTGRADIVGEQTLGRAGVQKLVRLPENRGLWLTYARYLTPKGEALHGKGIEPDLAVNDPDVEFGAPAPDTDPILDAAIARIATKKAA